MTCNVTTLLTARYSSLLGLDRFPHPFFPLCQVCNFFWVSLPFILFHFHFYCHFVSPLPSSLLFTNFFSPFFFPPFLCFLLFHIGSFSALPVVLRHFSHPPYLGLILWVYIPPLNFSVTELLFVLSSFIPKICPVLQFKL